MNSLARKKQPVVAFSREEADFLIEQIKEFHEDRWFHRTKLNSVPTQGDTTADYYFCGDKQQPKDFNEYLRSLAPKVEGAWLEEAVINRYLPGNYMPEHGDLGKYRYNMVIALNQLGDGVECSGVFHEDVAGEGIIFPSKSEPHRVPPVKHERYVVIFLYE